MDTNEALDKAAAAFDASMGNRPSPTPKSEGGGGKRPTENMFENLGEFVDGGDGPAGGDHLPNPTKSKKTPYDYQPDEDSGDDDSPDEGGGDDTEFETDEDGNVILDDDGNPVEKEGGEKPKKDEGDDDDDEDELVTVVVEGEEVEVPLKEALDGYVRMETFHRRLSKLDEIQTVVVAEGQKVLADREKLIAGFAELEEQMAALLPIEPDWDKLYAEDPKKARELEKQYKDVKAQIEGVKAKKAEAAEELQKEKAAQTVEYAKKEFNKFAAIAKWSNRNDMQKDLQSMKRTAETAGFTPEEYGQVYDSRMLNILRKASKYDRMMAARPKPVQKNGRTDPTTQGAGRTRTAPKGIDRAQKRLNQTGSIDDAAAVFARLIK